NGIVLQGNTTCPVIAGEDKFGCCFCRIATGDPHKLVKHLTGLACQPFEWFECQPCSKTFPDRRAFTRHQRMHAEERLFKCPLCPAKFSFNRDLAIHAAMHMSEKPYKCTICLKAFSRRSGLANHLQGHTDPRPYGCLHCPKVFKDQYSLHRHTHT
ncbi:unnamed protein product, partial [Ixodes persulcatus]